MADRRFPVSAFSKLRRLQSSGGLQRFLDGPPQITVRSRSDGLSVSGIPAHVNPQIASIPGNLLCKDGTQLPIRVSNTLLTGTSAIRGEIVHLQLANALKAGFIPLVVSSRRQMSGFFEALRLIYYEEDIHVISETNHGDYYLPFLGMAPADMADFFYRVAVTLNPVAVANSMLYKRYIDVCVRLFCNSSESMRRLTMGQMDHFALLNEIVRMREDDRITPHEESMLRSMADSAQSVSVDVLSVFHDFMYRMRRAFSRKAGRFPFNSSRLTEHRPVFVDLGLVSGVQPNAPFAQCYQWYTSSVMEAEFQANPNLANQRLLVIFDNLGGTELRWFSWMIDMPNSVMLFHYDDYYSQLSSSEDVREALAARMERVFFFRHINTRSAEWCSNFIGMRSIMRRSTTTRASQSWTDLLFPARDIHEQEVEEAWFKKEDIQRLGNAGIVYCSEGAVFRNGHNFSQFQFR